MIRIAIVDDADIICESIERFLTDFSKEHGIGITFDSFYSGDEIKSKLQNTYYDCIFLDIEIGTVSGIDVSRYLRETLKNETTEIIYISQHRQYAIDLFDFDPISFLLKPIDPQKLNHALMKLLKRLKINEAVFTFPIGKELYRVPLKDILYFESSDHKIIMHTLTDSHTFYDKMERLVSLLETQKFLFVHKSFLVNSKHIQKYEYESLLMNNGETIPIAQSKRKAIREWQLANDIEETGW